MDSIALTLLFTAPWVVLIVVLPGRVRPVDHVPPSMAESARRRLWST
jgi:hypothetical protein